MKQRNTENIFWGEVRVEKGKNGGENKDETDRMKTR